MVKRKSASNQQKATTTTTSTTTSTAASSSTVQPPSTRSSSSRSSNRTITTTTDTVTSPSSTTNNKKRGKASSTKATTTKKSKNENEEEVKVEKMFGTGKSKKQQKSSSSTASANKSLEMFQSLVEDPNDPNSIITMDGIALLGDKLGIDVTTDIRILVLLWKMDCCKDKPGCITLSEWTNGCDIILQHIDSFEAMIELLPSLDIGFLENTDFKDFYKFCFKFNLSGTHRTLPIEVVIELLQLVLKDRDPYKRIPSLCQFLQLPNSSYSCITMDQWCSFFDFNIQVGNDISNYDESTSAWPVLIDEFVEYLAKEQQQQQSVGP